MQGVKSVKVYGLIHSGQCYKLYNPRWLILTESDSSHVTACPPKGGSTSITPSSSDCHIPKITKGFYVLGDIMF